MRNLTDYIFSLDLSSCLVSYTNTLAATPCTCPCKDAFSWGAPLPCSLQPCNHALSTQKVVWPQSFRKTSQMNSNKYHHLHDFSTIKDATLANPVLQATLFGLHRVVLGHHGQHRCLHLTIDDLLASILSQKTVRTNRHIIGTYSVFKQIKHYIYVFNVFPADADVDRRNCHYTV